MSHARVLPALLALTALACGRAPEPDDLTMGSLLGGERAGVPVDDPASLDQAATVCAAGATEFGIDVSYYQGDIDWAQVAGAGVKYAIIRVSDGTGFNDPKFDTYWSGAGANGIKRGAYQFFRPNQDAIAQADLLIAKLQAVGVGELPPVIDVEATGGQSPAVVAEKIGQWIARVESVLGVTPIIYTGYYFWKDNVGGTTAFNGYPLWHAQYTSASCPKIADAWSDWAFWQYSSTGSVAGIPANVDMNRFNGSMADLLALLGATDPECEANPSLNTCDGSVIKKCTGGDYQEGDCGFFGAACSTLGGDAHCVHPYCLAPGENSAWCKDGSSVLATCTMGSYAEGDCGFYGATCSDVGGGHCVHPFCTLYVGAEDGQACMPDGQLVVCDAGQAELQNCPAFGGACSTDGVDHCVHPYCNVLVGGEDGTACTDAEELITCTNGQPEVMTCAPGYGGMCNDDEGPAHCRHPYCNVFVGGDDGAACTENDELIVCEGGDAVLTSCAPGYGGACSTDGEPHCRHPYCNVLVGADDGAACTDDGQLVTCTEGEAALTDCPSLGTTCDAALGACVGENGAVDAGSTFVDPPGADAGTGGGDGDGDGDVGGDGDGDESGAGDGDVAGDGGGEGDVGGDGDGDGDGDESVDDAGTLGGDGDDGDADDDDADHDDADHDRPAPTVRADPLSCASTGGPTDAVFACVLLGLLAARRRAGPGARRRRARRLGVGGALVALVALALPGCGADDVVELIDDCVHDDAELSITGPAQSSDALVDCTVTTDTGYASGTPFAIDVVIVDDKPVEIATANAYWVMKEAAAQDGVNLWIVSGFRTMAQQQYLYGCYVNCNCNNCNLAATPGYSNHQSGHALDLNTSAPGVFTWLKNHAAAYGFSRTVPSEDWHWEWWGGGPGGGVCGVEDPECQANPSLDTCDGTVMKRCVDGDYQEGDCGVFGAGCSTLGGDAHCVHPYCLAPGENSAWCKDGSSVLATCTMGSYAEGDCGFFGATCSDVGGGHCVHPFCSIYVGGEDGQACMPDGQLVVCSGGQAELQNCPAFGGACSTDGVDHCVHPYCNLLVGGEDGTACADDHQLVTCEGGQAELETCAPGFGGSCASDDEGGHCVHPYCNVLVGAEDGTACTDDDQLVTCAGGDATMTSCAPGFGGMCNDDEGPAHCRHPYCNVLVGGDDGAACTDEGALVLCAGGDAVVVDCAAEGATCDAALAACVDDEGVPLDAGTTPEPEPEPAPTSSSDAGASDDEGGPDGPPSSTDGGGPDPGITGDDAGAAVDDEGAPSAPETGEARNDGAVSASSTDDGGARPAGCGAAGAPLPLVVLGLALRRRRGRAGRAR